MINLLKPTHESGKVGRKQVFESEGIVIRTGCQTLTLLGEDFWSLLSLNKPINYHRSVIRLVVNFGSYIFTKSLIRSLDLII